MISQTAEYALRAVVCLASQPDKPMITPQIAKLTHVPPGYLSKVLQMLSAGEIVRSQRGLHGGFILAQPAAELTVLAVINTVDPIERINTCPLGLEHHGDELCPLHQSIDEAIARTEQAFAGHSIADLIANENKSLDLSCGCSYPNSKGNESASEKDPPSEADQSTLRQRD